jgi:SAM-dependent methyltransferase
VAAVLHPEADIRGWLAQNPGAADPYTRSRIEQSFDHVAEVLDPFGESGRRSVLDVGCGTAFHSFAFAASFDRVVGIDASRRRIARSRKLVGAAGVERVEFEAARGEGYRASEAFDLVYCNIMSDLTASRRALIETLAGATDADGAIFYAESCEGYAPEELAAAVARRDGGELRLRLRQIVNGFSIRPAFRFFLTGSAEPVFAQHGFEAVHVERTTWNGLTPVERLWLRRGAGSRTSPPGGPNADYAELDPNFLEVHRLFSAALQGREPSEAELLRRAAEDENPLAVFLVLLAMADGVPGARPREAGWLVARLRDKAPAALRPKEPDWARVGELLALFEAGLRERTRGGTLVAR